MDNQFNNEKNLDAVICGENLLYSFLTNPNKSYLDCVKEYLQKRNERVLLQGFIFSANFIA